MKSSVFHFCFLCILIFKWKNLFLVKIYTISVKYLMSVKHTSTRVNKWEEKSGFGIYWRFGKYFGLFLKLLGDSGTACCFQSKDCEKRPSCSSFLRSFCFWLLTVDTSRRLLFVAFDQQSAFRNSIRPVSFKVTLQQSNTNQLSSLRRTHSTMTTTPTIANQNKDSNGPVSTKRISSPKSVCVTDGQCQQV